MKRRNQKGATAIEYGLIASLISICILGSVAMTGKESNQVYCAVANAISSSVGNSNTYCGNLDFIPSEDGGTGKWGNNYIAYTDTIASTLESLNSEDPIVGVYGLYSIAHDNSQATATPVTNYDDAIALLNKNDWTGTGAAYQQSELTEPHLWPQFRVVTQGGKSYEIYQTYAPGTTTTIAYAQDLATGDDSYYSDGED